MAITLAAITMMVPGRSEELSTSVRRAEDTEREGHPTVMGVLSSLDAKVRPASLLSQPTLPDSNPSIQIVSEANWNRPNGSSIAVAHAGKA